MDIIVGLAELLVDRKYVNDMKQAIRMASVYRSNARAARIYKQISESKTVIDSVKQELMALSHTPTNRQCAILELVSKKGYYNNVTHPDIIELTKAGYIIPDATQLNDKGQAFIRITEKGVNYMHSLDRVKTIQALAEQQKNQAKSNAAAQKIQALLYEQQQERAKLEEEEQKAHNRILAVQRSEQQEES